MKLYFLFFLSIISLLECFNFHSFNFNYIIKKPLDSSIINFIKIHNINYFRIRENPKYLILRYLHEPLDDVYNYNNNFDPKWNIVSRLCSKISLGKCVKKVLTHF
jgi:hypothetical protein